VGNLLAIEQYPGKGNWLDARLVKVPNEWLPVFTLLTDRELLE